jgi:hypothetical protein
MCFFIFFGCKSTTKMSNESKNSAPLFTPQFTPGPQIYVYKTRNDYSNNVPVLLNDEQTEIISYPHPKDLKVGSGYPLPTSLLSGYFLDNRGINKNVAYLKMTYKEYANLDNPPSLQEMFKMIIDKDPLTELCDCGNKTAFTDIEKQLNQLITNNKLRTTCKTIK